jgi:hypothetical protein
MPQVNGAEIKVVGKSGQISLGKSYAGKTLRVERHDDGSIVLTAVAMVPENQLWTVEGTAAQTRRDPPQPRSKPVGWTEAEIRSYLRRHSHSDSTERCATPERSLHGRACCGGSCWERHSCRMGTGRK